MNMKKMVPEFIALAILQVCVLSWAAGVHLESTIASAQVEDQREALGFHPGRMADLSINTGSVTEGER